MNIKKYKKSIKKILFERITNTNLGIFYAHYNKNKASGSKIISLNWKLSDIFIKDSVYINSFLSFKDFKDLNSFFNFFKTLDSNSIFFFKISNYFIHTTSFISKNFIKSLNYLNVVKKINFILKFQLKIIFNCFKQFL